MPKKPTRRHNQHLGKPYQFYAEPTEFDAALLHIQQVASLPTAAAAMRYAILATAKRMQTQETQK